MYYIIEDEDNFQKKLKINHENNEEVLTVFISLGNEGDFENFKSLGIDLTKKQLHDFIGALLHVQQKMKGKKNE